jgi:hypothetical protein
MRRRIHRKEAETQRFFRHSSLRTWYPRKMSSFLRKQKSIFQKLKVKNKKKAEEWNADDADLADYH